jgi:16S rRNA (guanine527-N7)-methyltransferase
VPESDRSVLVGFFRETVGRDLSTQDLERIDRYLDLLELWNERLRLTGERDRATLLRKHVVDALACVPLIPPGARFLDVGTGGGLPGAVIACVRPDVDTTLLDARQRPISFLNEVIRTVPLSRTRAIAIRAEDAANDPSIAGWAAVATARALRMDTFFSLVRPLLAPGGLAISMQTPVTTAGQAATVAARHGFRLVETRDYQLPDGDERRLVVVS